MSSRWKVNITPTERAARILVGAFSVILGAILVSLASSAIGVVLELLLVLARLVTGATGHCPLYAKLGHIPASLRKKES